MLPMAVQRVLNFRFIVKGRQHLRQFAAKIVRHYGGRALKKESCEFLLQRRFLHFGFAFGRNDETVVDSGERYIRMHSGVCPILLTVAS
jgi:hypothetical protein